MPIRTNNWDVETYRNKLEKNKCKEISFGSNSPELQGNGRLLSGLKVPALILRSEF